MQTLLFPSKKIPAENQPDDESLVTFLKTLNLMQSMDHKNIHFDRFIHSKLGPLNEALYSDYIFFENSESSDLVVSISGVHGSEGRIGSIIQNQILNSFLESKLDSVYGHKKRPNILIIHNLNPFGRAWARRGNHQNIDLNRNSWSLTPPKNNSFQKFQSLLVCEKKRDFYKNLLALLPSIIKEGFSKTSSDLASGQSQYPGLSFYSGLDSSEEIIVLKKYLKKLSSPKNIFVIDIHTGLGAYAKEHLILNPFRGNHIQLQDLKFFFDTDFIDQNSFGFYETTGLLGENFLDIFPESEVFYFTQEFGTYSFLSVLQTLSYDSALWMNSGAANVSRMKKQIEAFFPNDLDWQTKVKSIGIQRFNQLLKFIIKKNGDDN